MPTRLNASGKLMSTAAPLAGWGCGWVANGANNDEMTKCTCFFFLHWRSQHLKTKGNGMKKFQIIIMMSQANRSK